MIMVYNDQKSISVIVVEALYYLAKKLIKLIWIQKYLILILLNESLLCSHIIHCSTDRATVLQDRHFDLIFFILLYNDLIFFSFFCLCILYLYLCEYTFLIFRHVNKTIRNHNLMNQSPNNSLLYTSHFWSVD